MSTVTIFTPPLVAFSFPTLPLHYASTYREAISRRVIVAKASSTFDPSFALVSITGIPVIFVKFYPPDVHSLALTLISSAETCRADCTSLLLPISSLTVSSGCVCLSTSLSQSCTWSNDSYHRFAPIAHLVGKVEDHDNPVRPAVVRARYRLVSFLTGGVPLERIFLGEMIRSAA